MKLATVSKVSDDGWETGDYRRGPDPASALHVC